MLQLILNIIFIEKSIFLVEYNNHKMTVISFQIKKSLTLDAFK